MKKLLIALAGFSLLFACSTVQNLTKEEVGQLEEHNEEIENGTNQLKKDKPLENAFRKWKRPQYENQKNVLGYDDKTFSVPEALKTRVDFWIDIYTKYTTSQGILHDSRYINIVYRPIDFTNLEKDKNLTSGQRLKIEKKFLDEQKKYVQNILLKLHETKDPSTLNEEELRYWKMFENVEEDNKFLVASKKGRLRFQLGQKDRFIQGIFYSGRYLRDLEDIFERAGLPKELTRLPFVESSFNIRARSKVGASGVWQFMRGTGKRYMTVNGIIDERNDPIISGVAAAKLLKQNYNILQSWPLAVTAYNFGASGLKRIVNKLNTTNLEEIYGRNSSSRFGFASESFYTSFLAALEVEKNADKYFGPLDISDEIPFAETQLKKSIFLKDLKPFFNNDEDLLKSLNPHFMSIVLKGSVRIPYKTKVRVPLDKQASFESYFSNQRVAEADQKDIQDNKNGVLYKINKGDTLYDISKQFQVSLDQLLQANQELDARYLRPGQTILIPQQ